MNNGKSAHREVAQGKMEIVASTFRDADEVSQSLCYPTYTPLSHMTLGALSPSEGMTAEEDSAAI